MMTRFVNAILLIFTLLVTLTGLYGIVWVMEGWVYEAHRIFAWGLVALLPWKTAISLRSLKRGLQFNFRRGLMIFFSTLLTGLLLFVFVLGLMWAWRYGPEALWLQETVISWHWILAMALLPPFILHSWQSWPRPKRKELLSRRSLLKTAGIFVFGALSWQVSTQFARSRQDAEHPRRISGSRLQGFLSGNQFPITTGAGDGRVSIDVDKWRLTLSSARAANQTFSYTDLLDMPQTTRLATLDCTIGWYTVQRWRGVAFTDLLNTASPSKDFFGVRLTAVSGESKTLPAYEAEQVLLATHVGGDPLSHWHGFPMRVVIPTRRGWFWIKWLEKIELI